MITLPFFTMRHSRDYYRQRGWVLFILLAPFPEEEQVPGEYIGALLNMELHLRARWPFARISVYAPRRDRLGMTR